MRRLRSRIACSTVCDRLLHPMTLIRSSIRFTRAARFSNRGPGNPSWTAGRTRSPGKEGRDESINSSTCISYGLVAPITEHELLTRKTNRRMRDLDDMPNRYGCPSGKPDDLQESRGQLFEEYSLRQYLLLQAFLKPEGNLDQSFSFFSSFNTIFPCARLALRSCSGTFLCTKF